jgi:hypothetical protein
MEHDDDPEKRIAELERMQGQAPAGRPVEQPRPYSQAPQADWQQPPTPYPPAPGWQQQPQSWQQPAGQSGFSPPPAYGTGLPPMPQPLQSGQPRRQGPFRAVFGWIVFVVVLLGFAGFAVHTFYAYSVGTPATATVVSCHSSGKSTTCTGTWTINGSTQSGKIDGNGKDYHTGQTLDVHVHDGTAYSRGSLSSYLWPGLFFVGFGALAVYGWIRKRRQTS